MKSPKIINFKKFTKTSGKLLPITFNNKFPINVKRIFVIYGKKKYKKKSNFRKPGNLMIKKLCKNWLIDLKQSFMIGDNQVDKLCAKKSNLYFEYSKTNFYNQVYKIINKI